MRKVMAYLCSALAAALFVAVIVATALCLIMGGFSGSALRMLPLLFVGSFLVVLAHTMVFGIPYALLLRRLERFRLVSMMIGGFLAACVPDIVFWVWLFAIRGEDVLRFARSPGSGDGWIQWAVLLGEGVLGALAAAVFYRVFRRILPEAPSGHVAVADGATTMRMV